MSRVSRDPVAIRLLGREDQVAPPASGELLPPDAGGNPLALVGGAYEAADRFDRELMTWNPTYQSADDDLLPHKRVMDSRVRDIMRNDAYAASGSTIRKDNIVGSQYLLNSKPEFDYLGLDEKWAEEFQEEVEMKFTLWAESRNNWVDASRVNNFTDLIRLGVGIHTMGGEILAVAEWMDDRPFKTAIQMIDLDRLEDPMRVRPGENIRGGVEKDRNGIPIAYHIREHHPSDWRLGLGRQRIKRIKTRKRWGRRNVIHIFEQFRPDQSRGVAEMVTALKATKTAQKFREAVLQNAVVNATYAASIESELPTEILYQALGSGSSSEEEITAAIQKYGVGYLGAIRGYLDSAKNIHLNGVRIPHLYPGTKLQLRPAGKGGPLGTEFEQSLLRYIAANLGVSYEQLSRDYSRTNYSSARAAMTETWKTMQSSKRTVADRFASDIFVLWLEEAIAVGEITSLPRNAPNFWDGLNSEAYSSCEWIGASKGQIDELKETQAAVLRLKYNLSTDEEELGRFGKDWRKVKRQRKREKEMDEAYGLTSPEDDNMMNATTGAPREDEAE